MHQAPGLPALVNREPPCPLAVKRRGGQVFPERGQKLTNLPPSPVLLGRKSPRKHRVRERSTQRLRGLPRPGLQQGSALVLDLQLLSKGPQGWDGLPSSHPFPSPSCPPSSPLSLLPPLPLPLSSSLCPVGPAMRSDTQGSVVQCLQIRLEDPLLGESALRQGRSSGGGGPAWGGPQMASVPFLSP